MVDVKIHYHGSVVGLVPITLSGREWIDEHVVSEGWQWLGNVLYVEPRYIAHIADGMTADGLTVE